MNPLQYLIQNEHKVKQKPLLLKVTKIKVKVALAGPDPEPMKEDQTGSDSGKLHVSLAGPNPEHMDKDYLATAYRKEIPRSNRLLIISRNKYLMMLHLKVLTDTHADFNRENSCVACPKSAIPKNLKRVPKELSKPKRNKERKKQEFQLTPSGQLIKWPMDKEVQTRLKDHKRKHDSDDDDEDDDDDEGPSAGSNQGRSTKRRRSDSAASGSAKPPPKDDDQSSKKPRESEASASKQHPALTSTGWLSLTQERQCASSKHRPDPETKTF
ncbi:hypothetical protein Tco_0909592 [Tanacetum coccineum]|uniref:Uncharacterized protein n=1 Tax=Tanacetum coccineum TaxID=301880 RepID=A0ABQ5CSE0_9ASTR